MKPSTLYLSYTGLLEPLGRSQVLSYLSRLSKNYSITLVTFEKKHDFTNRDEVEKLKLECDKYGINWQPRLYHHRPRLVAKVLDLMLLVWDVWRLSSKNDVKLIHCRSYLTSIAAWLVGKVTKVPFVFDMRALLPEELIDAGRLKRNSFVYRGINYFERKLLNDADSVVSLTSAAIPYLLNKYPFLKQDKFTVIPTCVDLRRFENYSNIENNKTIIGTMGSVVSGWYHLDWLINTLKLSEDIFANPTFKIITKDSPKVINELSESLSFDSNKLSIYSCSSEDIQNNIKGMLFGVLYFTSGVSKIGSAPTRMAEFLACGIPILGNSGVGDMDTIIKKYNIGVVVDGHSDDSFIKALHDMKALLTDPLLESRCKQVANEMFSADKGAAKYHEVYKFLLRQD
ncbi:glycosyltransferase [Vibrio sp. 10N.286.48.B7]|uniref:glycosyltransferase n=1 Tax=Vibrio sp. 10N.286.48.B7 TaxID=1880853 RepID=UPI000C8437C4|nr:glycosyltransferase [Vibrio sp. 10N.286.48.B7]PMH78208.1 hypothetical protein BCU58_10050 [Vibrio sp. 10N.286.48.B7]